jgi:hypothetical protein
MPEHMPDKMPDGMSKRLPNGMSEKMQDRMSVGGDHSNKVNVDSA